ncbi:MAG TPA: pyridoxal phosphate-dependent aminotransferase [Candidatus Paceibacterota bacterium]|nr:pyridoxal phosphate-dependent aminotransferase [Candidatus Paceibacterota bacterium]
MRQDIVHEGAKELSYEIREIAKLAHQIEGAGKRIYWENIGDPIAKGSHVPEWIKDIVQNAVKQDETYGYSPTKGLTKTREYLAAERNKTQQGNISPDDILFFNGLGDAVAKVYTYLDRTVRVIGPSPAYPTHSSAEAAHAGAPHLTYLLNPRRNWLPDLEDLRNKVQYNPNITGILIINPDNPTGMIYPKMVLDQIVELAREFDLFLISDEIYGNIAYGEERMYSLAELIDDVPGIVMRGLSKEIPWPGSRCGWIEVYNKHKDKNFERYIDAIENAKMLEVCSTTLPQAVLPEIFSDERYPKHLESRAAFYRKRAEEAYTALKDIPGITVMKPQGAFYISVVFDDPSIGEKSSLPIEDENIRRIIENVLREKSSDKYFVYYLLGATGICTVPLSGFNSALAGFRVTLLEEDDETFSYVFQTIAEKIREYLP